MEMAFLVQVRKSNKCGRVGNDEIFNLHLGQHHLPPGRHHQHLLIPSTQTINQEQANNTEMRSNSQQIVLYCLGLCTQNAGLRKVDLEPSPKRGIDKINMLKQTPKRK